jgi:ribonuclease HII
MRKSGETLIAGVDEVGRGPLAGPVVTAAVILDPAATPEGLADSKTLSPEKREQLFSQILRLARAVSFASADARAIDASNIRAATLEAMARAVAALSATPTLVLIDGRDGIATPIPCRAIIGGDATEPAIAAASIVAKVMRDRMMARLDEVHPGYGFAAHKGYGVAAHREAILALGPCPEHRFSFAPIKGRWRR